MTHRARQEFNLCANLCVFEKWYINKDYYDYIIITLILHTSEWMNHHCITQQPIISHWSLLLDILQSIHTLVKMVKIL